VSRSGNSALLIKVGFPQFYLFTFSHHSGGVLVLSQEMRNKKIRPTIHILGAFKERKHLFPSHFRSVDCFNECTQAIRDPMKGIIIPDERPDAQSNYVCVYVGSTGHVIGIPMILDDHADVWVVPTVKDLRKDFNNPNWFISNYNEVAKERGMQLLSLVVRGNNNLY